MRLNVGLIGLGRLGKVYARDLSSRLANTRLTAVADVDAAAAKEVAATFDVPHSYTDPREMLADRNVDAVVIASPTHTHKDVVIAAAASGKPTFCEKPLALSLDDCRTMQEAVERSGTFFQMGFMEPATAYLTGSIGADEATETIASRYLRLIEQWKERDQPSRRDTPAASGP